MLKKTTTQRLPETPKKSAAAAVLWKSLFLAAVILFFISNQAVADLGYPHAATVHGKYHVLKQVIYCPRDRHKYGNFRDYGYWRGGHWCGRHGKHGYWVWVYPNWYVWGHRR